MPSGSGTRRTFLLATALQAVSSNTTVPHGTAVKQEQLDWLIESGLGPLLYRLAPSSGYTASPDCLQNLQAADLTSRVLTEDLLSLVELILGLLNDVGVEPTLLKGIAHATRYYPAPHLRVMRDVDLLVPSGALTKATDAMIEAGFQLPSDAPPSRWQYHHHAPPLHHPDMDLWVELHTGVLPPSAEAFGEIPLDLGGIEQHQTSSEFRGQRVTRLSPEFEIAYLAVAWCRNLTTEFGRLGLQTPLIDAAYLLKATGERLEWERIIGWSKGTVTGASIYILMSYLHRHGAFVDSHRILPVLSRAQNFVGPSSAKIIHGILDRYLLDDRLPEQPLSVHVVGNIFDALIARRPFWCNWLSVPASVLFPRREKRRFQLRYHWDRLLSLIGR